MKKSIIAILVFILLLNSIILPSFYYFFMIEEGDNDCMVTYARNILEGRTSGTIYDFGSSLHIDIDNSLGDEYIIGESYKCNMSIKGDFYTESINEYYCFNVLFYEWVKYLFKN